jgi:hypothetical protein
VQTFLPYPDFARSAAALDSPRLGKQRVEVLQILRALTFPSYGWSNHPATLMWRGRVPALVSYGLAMVDAWTARGAADTTRAQITEFAPEVAFGAPVALAMPSWLGDDALHRSHQSNLVRKDPAFYEPQFPGVPGNLDYVWPGADALPPEPPIIGAPLLIFRPHSEQEFANWMKRREVSVGQSSPLGRQGPKWRAQVELFLAVASGSRMGILAPGGERIRTGEIIDGASASLVGGSHPEDVYRRPVELQGELARSEFPYPALLQDPRTLFEALGPIR